MSQVRRRMLHTGKDLAAAIHAVMLAEVERGRLSAEAAALVGDEVLSSARLWQGDALITKTGALKTIRGKLTPAMLRRHPELDSDRFWQRLQRTLETDSLVPAAAMDV
eukprot:g5283.t1